MKKPTYRIVLSGETPKDRTPATAAKHLARLFNIRPEKAVKLLSAKRTVLKSGLEAPNAKKMASAIRKAGFSCLIEECAPPGKPFECPKCGYTCTLPPDSGDGDICPSCQIVVQKYLDAQKKETAPETETPDASEKESQASTAQAESLLPTGPFKFVKWGITGFGALLFLFTGLTVFDMPSHEVMYSLEAAGPICHGDPRLKYHPELAAYTAEYGVEMACIKSYKMTLFNSGYRPQLQTVVRLNLPEDIKKKMTDRPMFLDYDRAQREVRHRRNGDVMSYAIGPMKSMDQVTIRFKIVMDNNEDVPWEDLLKRVDVAEGDAQKGDSPKLTMITRLFIYLINIPGGSLKEQAKNITDVFLSGADGNEDELNAEFDSTSADLTVSIESRGVPQKYYPGMMPHYTVAIRVFNNGPGDAEETRLIYTIPPEVDIRQHTLQIDNYQPRMYELLQESRQPRRPLSEPPPGCTLEDGEIICNIKSLPPESGATAHLQILSRGPGYYLYEARAECKQSDPDESDNEAELAIDFSPEK